VQVQLDRVRVVSAADPEAAWDAITAGEGFGGPLLVDDLDLLLRRCTEDERRRLLDTLQTALRAGHHLIVVTARRTTDGVAALRDAFDDVLLLRAASRQEHQLLAVDGEPYRGDLPPGGGWWRGERLQVFEHPPVRPRAVRASVLTVPVGEQPVAVLTHRAGRLRSGLSALTPVVLDIAEARATEPTGAAVVLGSVAEWSQARSLLEGLRRRGAVVVDVPPGEARLLLGQLGPPPLCVGDRVLLERDGVLERARWPSREEARQEGIGRVGVQMERIS
jgi:S-DNA-T family DNA segregation ATPase FtsK/SpoIIIE